MQGHEQRGVRTLWPHPHPSEPAPQVQGCVGPPSGAPQTPAVPPKPRQCPLPVPPTHRGGGSGISSRFSLSQRCSAGAQRDPRVSPSPPKTPPGPPKAPLSPPRSLLHTSHPQGSPSRILFCTQETLNAPTPPDRAPQTLGGGPPAPALTPGSVCPVPPWNPPVSPRSPAHPGGSCCLRAGRSDLGEKGGVMGGSRGVSEGPQPPPGQSLSPALTFQDERHEGDEGGLHLGQHLPIGLVVPAGVLGGNGGVRFLGGALDTPSPCWWPWAWGWWPGGGGQGHPRTIQDSPGHLGDVPCSPPGDPPTPPAAPKPLTHRQVLKFPKQVLEFPWELLEDKKKKKRGGEGWEHPEGSGSTKGEGRRLWELPGKDQGASEGVQEGLEAFRGDLGAPRGVLGALSWE